MTMRHDCHAHISPATLIVQPVPRNTLKITERNRNLWKNQPSSSRSLQRLWVGITISWDAQSGSVGHQHCGFWPTLTRLIFPSMPTVMQSGAPPPPRWMSSPATAPRCSFSQVKGDKSASSAEGFMASSKKTDREPTLEAEATTVCWWSWDGETLKVVERAGRLQLFCVSSSHGEEDCNCCCSTISGFSSNALSCRNDLRVRESQTASASRRGEPGDGGNHRTLSTYCACGNLQISITHKRQSIYLLQTPPPEKTAHKNLSSSLLSGIFLCSPWLNFSLQPQRVQSTRNPNPWWRLVFQQKKIIKNLGFFGAWVLVIGGEEEKKKKQILPDWKDPSHSMLEFESILRKSYSARAESGRS